MAAAALPPARRWPALGAILLAGVALGAALGNGAGSVRLGALPNPSEPTFLLAIAGLVAGALSLRSTLVLRLLPAVALYATAGLALTRYGPGPGVAFAAAPLALWAARLGRGRVLKGGLPSLVAGGMLGLLVSAPQFGIPGARWTLPLLPLVMGLAITGAVTALVNPGRERPRPVRFDLRVSLALAGLVCAGFILAFGLGQFGVYLATPREYGGLGVKMPWIAPLLALGGVLASGFDPPRFRSARASIGLGILVLGFLLLATGGRAGAVASHLIVPTGLAVAVPSCIRRAQRAHEALGVGTLFLATLVGMPLATILVTAFSRPLPAPIAAAGAEVLARTNWMPVLLFYALLALVVLLAHLAHAYEFGLAALDPADDRDPLPILRKGLPKRGQKS